MAAEKKIAGVIYRFEPLTGWEALDALELLFKVAGPLVPILEAVLSDKDEERTKAIVRIAPDILRSHDSASMRALAEALFRNCQADKDPVVVGVKPQSLSEMFQVFAFCLEKQFADFFGGAGVGSLLALLPSAPAKKSP